MGTIGDSERAQFSGRTDASQASVGWTFYRPIESVFPVWRYNPVKNPEVYVGFFGATLEQVKDGSKLVSATAATT